MKITDIDNTYITADHHFNDTRFNVLYRDFSNRALHDDYLIRQWNNTVSKNSTVIHLGDFSVNEYGYRYTQYLNGTIHLLKGNYDELYDDDFLLKYFTSVQTDMVMKVDNQQLYLNHYPTKGKLDMFNVVGHIHSLWKVQRNMVNVGIDCWDYKPITIKQLLFTINAIRKYYDTNVFAGELECNKKTI